MKELLIALLSFCILPSWAASGLKAKGYVFNDVNKNHVKDKTEKGIGNVAVTNGRDVVVTDNKGFYELPVYGKETFISVIKPSHYTLSLNDYNKSQFYYVYKPEGSLSRKEYKGIEPTGKLPRYINFPLIQTKESENYTALVFGDPQPHSLDHVNYFKESIVSELENYKTAAFGISLGDIVDEDFSLYRPYDAAIRTIGIPWYNVMGNHDMDYEATTDSLSDDAFEAFEGPANYAFNYANTHILVLDDVLYPDPRHPHVKKHYWGGFRPDQKAFISNDLEKVDTSKLVIVAFHIPLLGNDAVRSEDTQFLFRQLKRFPHVLILSGHTHRQEQIFHTLKDGWEGARPLHEYNVGTTCGSWWSGFLDKRGIPESCMPDGTPKGYAFLNIKGNSYTIRYKVAGQPDDYQMSINVPAEVVQDRYTPADIVVNFFMGGFYDTVRYRIDKGTWKAMRRAAVEDPDYNYMLQRWNRSVEPKYARWPSPAQISSHIWCARINSHLSLGKHVVEVEVRDMYGIKYTAQKSYEIVAPRRAYP